MNFPETKTDTAGQEPLSLGLFPLGTGDDKPFAFFVSAGTAGQF